jgi:DnaJ-class molecular chaperone
VSEPYKCPVCNGKGIITTPPWLPGNAEGWLDSTTKPYPCKACKGTGIIWEKEIAELGHEVDEEER